MADSTIRIAGIHPTIDGEYPIDIAAFTNRDFNDIKRIAKVRSQELAEAFQHGDTDLFVAFAVIALRHAGKPFSEDALWDTPVGQITLLDSVEEAEEALPPASAPPSSTQSEPGGGVRQNGQSESSGLASSGGSVHLVADPSLSGGPSSGTGVMSALETSAI